MVLIATMIFCSLQFFFHFSGDSLRVRVVHEFFWQPNNYYYLLELLYSI